MADENSIRSIIETYELPNSLEDKILAIANQNIPAYSPGSSQSNYDYIASLVDKFTRPYEDRFLKSLDEAVGPDDRRTRHELIGGHDYSLKELIPGKNQRKRLHAHELIELLEDHLERPYLELISDLLPGTEAESFLWGLSPKHVTGDMDSIKKVLLNLEAKYGSRGTIILPPRPIISVRRNSQELDIRFGARKYNGNPLAFYESNQEIYQGMGRTELARFDQGMYQSLRVANQLDQAIPEKRYKPGKKLSKEQVNLILKTFKANGGHLANTAKTLSHSPGTVRTYLRKNQIIPGPKSKNPSISKSPKSSV